MKMEGKCKVSWLGSMHPIAKVKGRLDTVLNNKWSTNRDFM